MISYTYTKIINPLKLQEEIIVSGLESINHIDTSGEEVIVWFSDELTEEQQETLTTAITVHSAALTTAELITRSINAAKVFGDETMSQFTLENVQLGITQAGKTNAVSDYLHKLSHYLSTGSLYAAITEIDNKIAALDGTLSPFVTEARMTSYKNKIQDYLGIPRT